MVNTVAGLVIDSNTVKIIDAQDVFDKTKRGTIEGVRVVTEGQPIKMGEYIFMHCSNDHKTIYPLDRVSEMIVRPHNFNESNTCFKALIPCCGEHTPREIGATVSLYGDHSLPRCDEQVLVTSKAVIMGNQNIDCITTNGWLNPYETIDVCSNDPY